jgi:deoxyribonuclease V
MELEKLKALQIELKNKIHITPYTGTFKNVLAIDSSYLKKLNKIISMAIVYDANKKEIVDKAFAIQDVKFPYIPGFLSFREIDTTLSAIKKIHSKYDLVLVDGQGIAHPRGFGFASHLGVLLEKPTIGCAKSRLVGSYNEVGAKRGDFSYLIHNSEVVGAVLRTKAYVKPIFISPGNLIDIDSSIKIVLQLTEKYRLPEPIRFAHIFAEDTKRLWEK